MQKRKSELTQLISRIRNASQPVEDALALVELAREAGDTDQEAEILQLLDLGQERLDDLELDALLSGPNDRDHCFLTVNAGAGGTESQDWAEMLLRMYSRYCEQRGWSIEVVDFQPGDEAGIKSANILIQGEYAYGYLKAENGIHRLVRISPFDAAKRRHTSFAAVFAYPDVENQINIDIDEKDLRIDVFRSSGAGGQKVNKTSSAIRVTHIPTGIIVQCQNERSQYKNKDMALKVLKARLFDLEKSKQDAKRDQVEAGKARIDFGSQIRSYVLAPYRLVKDHRTGFEMGNASAVLDGQIHGFIKAFLLKRTVGNTDLGDLP